MLRSLLPTSLSPLSPGSQPGFRTQNIFDDNATSWMTVGLLLLLFLSLLKTLQGPMTQTLLIQSPYLVLGDNFPF